MNYETAIRFLGLPLLHVSTGRSVEGSYRRGIARGWVAIGDIAFGVLFSAGGIAVGGAAFAWSGAFGGLTVAHHFATGGLAVALHANDPAATAYFAEHPFFQAASWTMQYSLALAFIPSVAALVARMHARRGSQENSGAAAAGEQNQGDS